MTPWAVLGFGALTGKYLDQEPEAARLTEGTWRERFLSERNLAIAREVVAVARAVGRSPAQEDSVAAGMRRAT